MPDPIERLSQAFERFPGIGPRQAGRFVQYVLRNASIRRELVEGLQSVSGGVRQCTRCFRYHATPNPVCSICSQSRRDQTSLAVVASDADLLALERSQTYRGQYLVLGGTISLASESIEALRVPELIKRLEEKSIREVILSFPANPEGDATQIRIKEELEPIAFMNDIRISSLGRGLSTGSELEYADADTLKSALENRK